MTRKNLKAMSDEQLVEEFVRIALQQDEAILYDEIAKFNRLFDLMDEVKKELKSRPGDRRRVLMRLYDHENAQVRLKAAIATLAVAPAAARQALDTIAQSRKPQAADAGMTIFALDDGIFKPT